MFDIAYALQSTNNFNNSNVFFDRVLSNRRYLKVKSQKPVIALHKQLVLNSFQYFKNVEEKLHLF